MPSDQTSSSFSIAWGRTEEGKTLVILYLMLDDDDPNCPETSMTYMVVQQGETISEHVASMPDRHSLVRWAYSLFYVMAQPKDRRREGGHQCLRKLRRLFDPHRGNPRVRGSGALASGGGVGSMATVTISKKACAVNPLKISQPIGGALAFMGLRGAMPLLHGSQGCTSFGLVLFVRHFKEAIPLQTTAMSEVATILGGFENVEQAVLNIFNRTRPEIIGICSTGVTETKGDDVEGYIRLIRERNPQLGKLPLVYVATPDFKDAFQDGWEKAVTKMVETLVEAPGAVAPRDPKRVNVLPGCHLTPGDLDELRAIIEDFGLVPSFLPDLAGSLDGHIPDEFIPTTIGGIGVEEVAAMGCASWTIAIGAQMRPLPTRCKPGQTFRPEYLSACAASTLTINSSCS